MKAVRALQRKNHFQREQMDNRFDNVHASIGMRRPSTSAGPGGPHRAIANMMPRKEKLNISLTKRLHRETAKRNSFSAIKEDKDDSRESDNNSDVAGRSDGLEDSNMADMLVLP